MEVLVDGINVVVGVGLVKQVGCKALCILDFTEGFGKVKVDAVALVQSGSDEYAYQSLVEMKRGGQRLMMYFKCKEIFLVMW